MPIINFNIKKPLEKKVEKTIKEQGFASKAEFFRFAALHYMNSVGPDISQEEYEKSIRALKSALKKKYRDKKLPSLEKQLSEIH